VIDLKLLHHALTLARHRNFARAAEALDMSQPALSRSISGLEASLGVPLFNRTTQGVTPTAYGERYLGRGGRLLSDAAELERELKLMQGLDAGILRIGAGPYPGDMCVAAAIGRLTSRHPHLRIELESRDWRSIVKHIVGAQLDIAVVELSAVETDPRLKTEALPRHLAVFYCRAGHPILKENAPTLAQMFTFPFAGPKLPVRAAQDFFRMARSGAIDPDSGDYLPPIRVDTVAMAKAIVLASDAIAIAPFRLIAGELKAGTLATLPFSEPWLHTYYGFVHLKERPLSPAAEAFIAEVKTIEAELVNAERPGIHTRPSSSAPV
jgi:DNA-binding transcriptional LysR family regulator